VLQVCVCGRSSAACHFVPVNCHHRLADQADGVRFSGVRAQPAFWQRINQLPVAGGDQDHQ
jgi:hypothetical protein